MRKTGIIILMSILNLCVLHGCGRRQEPGPEIIKEMRADSENTESQKETQKEIQQETQDDKAEETYSYIPTKKEAEQARELALEGMTKEAAERLTENIKAANLQMEWAYLQENFFTELEDRDSLYWNYFDQKGEIQIGWSYEDGTLSEMVEFCKKEDLTMDQFYEKYGTAVTAYNRFDADNFVALMQEMAASVQNEKLCGVLQAIIDETGLAASTHEAEHAEQIYKMLHDLDYFLLRYGPEDVGKYTRDTSVVCTYYGTLWY